MRPPLASGSRLLKSRRARAGRQQERGRQALVLSGGGSRASFEIGALRYLYDVVGIRPRVIAGSSAGSILAAVLAQGATRAEQREALGGIERVWREMTSPSDMYQETAWFATMRKIAPEWLEVFQRFRRPTPVGRWPLRPTARDAEEDVDRPTDAALWAPFRSVEAMLALRALGRTGRDLEKVLAAAERSQGIFVPGRVATQIQDPAVFDPARVGASGVELRLAVVGLESGELRFVTERGRLVDRLNRPVRDTERVGLADAVRASAALPVVFPPVRLSGEHYVDGGVRDVLPLEIATRHLGATRCYAVVASAVGSARESSYADKNMLAIMYRSFSDIMWDEVLRDEVELARSTATVTVIQPEFDVHDGLTVDPGLIALAIDYGYMRAADVVRGSDEAGNDLTRRIVELRRDIWTLENRVEAARTMAAAPEEPAGEAATPALPSGSEADDVAELAALKHQLRDLVQEKEPAHLPDGASDWWRRWEGHTWAVPAGELPWSTRTVAADRLASDRLGHR